ncbi:hypothetical protein EVAR_84272_1 [Eumeta japonica]|uniref:Uncharacterized protein n=1 Tax=Eumeta variegata TaxID=151549 RepID=A0A4C1WQY3_EUMVA|nr:hypothetical protein EVAR_84272_1 [Eumeta japonica]
MYGPRALVEVDGGLGALGGPGCRAARPPEMNPARPDRTVFIPQVTSHTGGPDLPLRRVSAVDNKMTQRRLTAVWRPRPLRDALA